MARNTFGGTALDYVGSEEVGPSMVGATVWMELFLRWPLEAVIVLLAMGGWWDYMRRRAKLRPPDY